MYQISIDELGEDKRYTGESSLHFLTKDIMGGVPSCSVIFASLLGRQGYSLAQICYNKEQRTVARYGMLVMRDEPWYTNLISDDPAKALGTRQSSFVCFGHRAAYTE